MGGSTLTSADLDVRRRRLLFRAWHRGTREMDLLVGPFADAALAGMSDAELDDFERLVEVPDQDLLGWIMNETAAPPPAYDTPLFRKLKDFHHSR
jgi:antitoxin CptB